MDSCLRPATHEDLEFIQNCAISAYEVYVERIGQKPAPMIADFATHIESSEVEVILFGDQRIGYCISFQKGDALFIENIALDPAHQGKGLATKVFSALESRARDVGLAKMSLYTNAKMYENLKFYPKLGFQETERRMEDGFHRVFFEKQL